MTMPVHTRRDAVFSDCGTFRMELSRIWDDSLPKVAWCCLNPSVAGRDIDDPTARKIYGFSSRGGFGGYYLVNLYSYIATLPTSLRSAGWLVGPGNDAFIEAAVHKAGGRIVCAWGADARGLARPVEVTSILKRLGARRLALRLTADGIPCHPARLPYSLTFQLMP